MMEEDPETAQDGNISEEDTTEEMRGIKLPQHGLTQKPRWKQEERQERWRISTKFVTFILSRMKFSTAHRKGKSKEIEKKCVHVDGAPCPSLSCQPAHLSRALGESWSCPFGCSRSRYERLLVEEGSCLRESSPVRGHGVCCWRFQSNAGDCILPYFSKKLYIQYETQKILIGLSCLSSHGDNNFGHSFCEKTVGQFA